MLQELLEQIETGKNVDAGVQHRLNTAAFFGWELANFPIVTVS
jgi:hypothetical protein